VKLPQKQRQALLAGELVEHKFPGHSRSPLRVDGVYALHGDGGGVLAQVRVLLTRRIDGVPVAVLRLEGDPVRLLAKGGGYTDYEGRAMSREEPEAVLEDCGRRVAGGGWCCERHIVEQVRSEEKDRARETVERAKALVAQLSGGRSSLALATLERRLVATERKLT
jgi:DNA-directed RNA polymerase subunit N (RpoN/RPB10)